ncbi:MAG: succinate dehydrogenase, hydrophobic membrane anchor protein [Deltaproteobacteria bacterium]|nr:succinate dehydrogenase, hydrophobic membrane anchor protein [Deltaproteobacteria bacterium]
MSLRSPLGRVLGLGSAKDGTDHWWAQRVSAAALALLGLWFAISIATLQPLEYAAARDFIAAPLNSVLLVLLTLTMAYHSYLGLQVVIEDYVHAAGAKIAALVASKYAHVFLSVAGVYAILKIGFTA